MMIINDDCLEAMKKMEDNSIDFIVTDPPYGLKFMGKKWDYAIPDESYWREMLRILKPGGHLAAMGGSRTFHRLTTKIEDSGFEIRDCIMWLYGSGFPKSHNNFGLEGYGTALKPAHEPILLCKKPYEISSLFVTILLDITNEVYKCQKLNYNVNDAETNLSDTLLLLDKVHQSIVQENVKTYAWEKLADVQYVIQNFTSLDLELKEKINQAKELFALISAKDNHNASTRDQKILAGEVECIFASIQDIVIFATMEHTKQNIVLLWKNILIGIFQGLNKFTIRTVINLITELRILKSCLHPNILNDTGNFSPNFEPIILAMKPLDGTFAQNAGKWGLGGINIDESRIEGKQRTTHPSGNIRTKSNKIYGDFSLGFQGMPKEGRWPANLILDEEAAEMLDEQSGQLSQCGGPKKTTHAEGCFGIGTPQKQIWKEENRGASRFFYCAKASQKERNAGLEGNIWLDNIKHVMYNETIQLTAEEANVWQDMALKVNIPWDSDIPQNMAIIDSYFGIKSPKLQELLYTMCICGRRPSGRFLKVLMYTTLMETSKTTALKIFNWLIKWSIKESTQDAKQLMEFGLNPANCAENLSQLTEIIGIFQKKDGLCMVDAKNAISPKSWLIREQEKLEKELQKFSGGHPTVKPLSLMRYIIKLLAPPNDPLLLDPFTGSGSTLIAAKELGIRYIGIEKETEYCEIAQKRLDSFKLKDQFEFNF